jgi:hypothetical protein
MHRLDAAFHLGQARRIELDAVAVMAQGMGRLLQLDLGALDGFQRCALQRGVVVDQLAQPGAHALDLPHGRQFALGQPFQRFLDAGLQRGGMGQPLVLHRGLGPAAGIEAKRRDLLHLPGQHLAFAGKGLVCSFPRPGAPPSPCARPQCSAATSPARARWAARPSSSWRCASAAQQAVMGVLAMDVGEEIGGFAQLGQRRRHAVDVAARAAARLDHAPQQAGIAVEIVGVQPARPAGCRPPGELGGDLGLLATAAHRGRHPPARPAPGTAHRPGWTCPHRSRRSGRRSRRRTPAPAGRR